MKQTTVSTLFYCYSLMVDKIFFENTFNPLDIKMTTRATPVHEYMTFQMGFDLLLLGFLMNFFS